LRKRLSPDRVKEKLGGIGHQRFRPLQKRLIKDLDGAGFRTIALDLYLRLGGWSHTGGTYVNAMAEVRALCRELFGYELPERIGKIRLKDIRYRSSAGLAKIAPLLIRFHEEQLGKG
jgi:hypothetical protein